MIKKLEKVVFK